MPRNSKAIMNFSVKSEWHYGIFNWNWPTFVGCHERCDANTYNEAVNDLSKE